MSLTVHQGKIPSVVWKTDLPHGTDRESINFRESPVFSLDNCTWCLKLKRKRNKYSREETWRMYLRKLVPADGQPKRVHVTIYMERQPRKIIRLDGLMCSFSGRSEELILWFGKSLLAKEHPHMLSNKGEKDALTDGQITFRCAFQFGNGRPATFHPLIFTENEKQAGVSHEVPKCEGGSPSAHHLKAHSSDADSTSATFEVQTVKVDTGHLLPTMQELQLANRNGVDSETSVHSKSRTPGVSHEVPKCEHQIPLGHHLKAHSSDLNSISAAFEVQVVKVDTGHLLPRVQELQVANRDGMDSETSVHSKSKTARVSHEVPKCEYRSPSAHHVNVVHECSIDFHSIFATFEIQTEEVDTSHLQPTKQELQLANIDGVDALTMDTAFYLYGAAEKHGVHSLKEKCTFFLIENLTEGNACKVLLLADMSGDTQLADAATYFIVHRNGFFHSPQWKAFAIEQPALKLNVYREHVKTII